MRWSGPCRPAFWGLGVLVDEDPFTFWFPPSHRWSRHGLVDGWPAALASVGSTSPNAVTPLIEKCVPSSVPCLLHTGHSCVIRQDRCHLGFAKARQQEAAGRVSSILCTRGAPGRGPCGAPCSPTVMSWGLSPRTGRVRKRVGGIWGGSASRVGGWEPVILAYGSPLAGTVDHGGTCSPQRATEWSPVSTWWPSRPSAPGINWHALNRGCCMG